MINVITQSTAERRVKDIMNLPRPTRKHIINDGEILPIISIGVEEYPQ